MRYICKQFAGLLHKELNHKLFSPIYSGKIVQMQYNLSSCRTNRDLKKKYFIFN